MDADQRQPDPGEEQDVPQPSTQPPTQPPTQPSEELIKGLEALYAKGPEIPSAVDERILQMAQQQMGAGATDSRAESSGILARIGPRNLKIGSGVGALLAASVALAIWIALPSSQPKEQFALEGEFIVGEDSFANLDPDSGLRSSQLRNEFRRESAQAPMAQSSAPTPAEPNAESAPARSLAERSRDVGQEETDAVGGLAKADLDDTVTEGAGVSSPALADRADAPAPADVELAEEARALDPADIDANGTLDILDAFALARAIDAADFQFNLAWDINQDGRVDNADVASIALAVVSLDRPRASGGAS